MDNWVAGMPVDERGPGALACDAPCVRMSEFWQLVDGEFGPGRGRTLVRDHVIGLLGHRTAEQALDAGDDPRTVWLALCDDLDVPADRRWGREDRAAGRRRRR